MLINNIGWGKLFKEAKNSMQITPKEITISSSELKDNIAPHLNETVNYVIAALKNSNSLVVNKIVFKEDKTPSQDNLAFKAIYKDGARKNPSGFDQSIKISITENKIYLITSLNIVELATIKDASGSFLGFGKKTDHKKAAIAAVEALNVFAFQTETQGENVYFFAKNDYQGKPYFVNHNSTDVFGAYNQTQAKICGEIISQYIVNKTAIIKNCTIDLDYAHDVSSRDLYIKIPGNSTFNATIPYDNGADVIDAPDVSSRDLYVANSSEFNMTNSTFNATIPYDNGGDVVDAPAPDAPDAPGDGHGNNPGGPGNGGNNPGGPGNGGNNPGGPGNGGNNPGGPGNGGNNPGGPGNGGNNPAPGAPGNGGNPGNPGNGPDNGNNPAPVDPAPVDPAPVNPEPAAPGIIDNLVQDIQQHPIGAMAVALILGGSVGVIANNRTPATAPVKPTINPVIPTQDSPNGGWFNPDNLLSPNDEFHTPEHSTPRPLKHHGAGSQAEAEFDKILGRANLHAEESGAEGNCFFYAIARAMHFGPREIGALREAATNYILTHPEQYRGFVDDLDTYIDRMSQDGEWADNPVIHAMVNRLGINLHIHHLDGHIVNIVPDNNIGNIPDVHIAFHQEDQHYLAVMPGAPSFIGSAIRVVTDVVVSSGNKLVDGLKSILKPKTKTGKKATTAKKLQFEDDGDSDQNGSLDDLANNNAVAPNHLVDNFPAAPYSPTVVPGGSTATSILDSMRKSILPEAPQSIAKSTRKSLSDARNPIDQKALKKAIDAFAKTHDNNFKFDRKITDYRDKIFKNELVDKQVRIDPNHLDAFLKSIWSGALDDEGEGGFEELMVNRGQHSDVALAQRLGLTMEQLNKITSISSSSSEPGSEVLHRQYVMYLAYYFANRLEANNAASQAENAYNNHPHNDGDDDHDHNANAFHLNHIAYDNPELIAKIFEDTKSGKIDKISLPLLQSDEKAVPADELDFSNISGMEETCATSDESVSSVADYSFLAASAMVALVKLMLDKHSNMFDGIDNQ